MIPCIVFKMFVPLLYKMHLWCLPKQVTHVMSFKISDSTFGIRSLKQVALASVICMLGSLGRGRLVLTCLTRPSSKLGIVMLQQPPISKVIERAGFSTV